MGAIPAILDHNDPSVFGNLERCESREYYARRKWGCRGILAWDLFRVSTLVQWGYVAGYVTYHEALALLQPAAQALSESFKSRDEACDQYGQSNV